MKIIERIYQVLEIKGVAPTKLEKEISLSNGYLSVQKKRNADIGEGIILKIVDYFPEISPEWLLTGKGEMLKSSNQSQLSTPSTQLISSNEGIPLIPISAMAGSLTFDIDGITLEQCEHYFIPEFTKKKADFMVRVAGSSMQPTFSSGDIVACKKITDILFFQWGQIYVIDSSQGVLIKRIFPDQDNQDNIILHSDNTNNYPPFQLPKSDIRSLSLVIGVIRLE